MPPRGAVPFFRSGGPSKKGTGTVAGGRFVTQRVTEATEPVPIFDSQSCAVERIGRQETRNPAWKAGSLHKVIVSCQNNAA